MSDENLEPLARVRFSGQAEVVTNAHRPDGLTPERTYLDELLRAIRDDEESRLAARRYYLNEWTEER